MNKRTLSIYDSRNNKLIAVLQKHGSEATVLEGDPDILPKFGLDRFDDLEQMEKHINERMSLIHAEPGEDMEKAEDPNAEQPAQPPGDTPDMAQADPHQAEVPESAKPQVPTEDVDGRIKPAIEILKRLLQVAEAKHKQKAENDTQLEQAQLEQQSAQVAQEQPYQAYVSVDGDDIGNKVFQAEEKDDEAAIAEISNRINQGQDYLRQWAQQNGGKVIEAGGDEGLLKVPSMALDHVEEMRQNYYKLVQATLSVGIGKKISEAGKARQLAKLRGKNQVVKFDEGTQAELDMRLEQQDIDAKEKLKMLTQSGVGTGGMNQPVPEEVADQEDVPKFGAPDGHYEKAQQDQAEYEQWIKDGQPEEDEVQKEKPQRAPGMKRLDKKKVEERRAARDMASETGENHKFLTNILSSVRRGE